MPRAGSLTVIVSLLTCVNTNNGFMSNGRIAGASNCDSDQRLDGGAAIPITSAIEPTRFSVTGFIEGEAIRMPPTSVRNRDNLAIIVMHATPHWLLLADDLGTRRIVEALRSARFLVATAPARRCIRERAFLLQQVRVHRHAGSKRERPVSRRATAYRASRPPVIGSRTVMGRSSRRASTLAVMSLTAPRYRPKRS